MPLTSLKTRRSQLHRPDQATQFYLNFDMFEYLAWNQQTRRRDEQPDLWALQKFCAREIWSGTRTCKIDFWLSAGAKEDVQKRENDDIDGRTLTVCRQSSAILTPAVTISLGKSRVITKRPHWYWPKNRTVHLRRQGRQGEWRKMKGEPFESTWTKANDDRP